MMLKDVLAAKGRPRIVTVSAKSEYRRRDPHHASREGRRSPPGSFVRASYARSSLIRPLLSSSRP